MSGSLNGKPDDIESRRKWTTKDWYTHLGAWENDKGQLCFGSTIAFAIMLEQFHAAHTYGTKDLLEALECLYQCITEAETSGPDARAALEKAREAIAKARGDV